MAFRGGRGGGRGGGGFNSLGSRLGGGGGNNGHGGMDVDMSSGFGAMASVQFRNWQGGSKEDLVNFIRRKTDVSLQNVYVSGPILHGSVHSSQAYKVGKSHGLKFAGGVLEVKVDQAENNNSNNNNTVEALKQFLRSRYNPQAKMLDLTNMKGDQNLQQMGVFATQSTSAKMFPALMKIAAAERDVDVESVNLASNNLQEVSTVTTLAQTFPDLKNLSLADNQISRMRNMEAWRHKFRYLRELILAGNPVITNEPTYKDELLKMFPRLVMLDGIMVRDESQIDILKLPVKVKHTFFENPDVQNVSSNFLASYFNLFDSDRTQLLQLYDDLSMFSLSVNSSAPRVMTNTSTGPQSWSQYIPLSRNLFKISVGQRQPRLALGTQSIANTFRRLPETKHALMESPEKFAIDVWRTQSIRQPDDTGIVISIHGEFTERTGAQATRSFDRTFVVLQNDMGNMIVASDTMTIRAWSGDDAFKETPPGEQPQNSNTGNNNNTLNTNNTPTTNDIPPELDGLNNDQLMMIQNLIGQTRLTAKYARMCAEQANFDLQQALALFQQSQAQLPPDAFTQ